MLINCRLTGSSTEQSTQEGVRGTTETGELDGSVGEWEVGWAGVRQARKWCNYLVSKQTVSCFKHLWTARKSCPRC